MDSGADNDVDDNVDGGGDEDDNDDSDNDDDDDGTKKIGDDHNQFSDLSTVWKFLESSNQSKCGSPNRDCWLERK